MVRRTLFESRKFLSVMDLSSRIFDKFISKIYSKQLFIENIDLKYWRRIEIFAKTCDFWEFPERELLSEINLRWNERVDLRKNLRSEIKITWTENNRNIQGQPIAAACTDILRPQMIVKWLMVIILTDGHSVKLHFITFIYRPNWPIFRIYTWNKADI